jgi:hypothetical protein
LSTDNAVIGQLSKRPLYTVINKKDFLGSLDTNPYYFRHYDLSHFTLFYNGKPIHSEGLPMNMDHEKTSVLAYNTLFEGLDIRHSNAGLQLTHDMLIAGYCMLMFDVTTNRATSEGHISLPVQCNIRLELRFDKPLPDAVMCLLYLEYDNSLRIDQLHSVSADFLDNGRGSDSMHSEGRDFVPGRLSVRHSTAAFCNSSGDSYLKFGTAHV